MPSSLAHLIDGNNRQSTTPWGPLSLLQYQWLTHCQWLRSGQVRIEVGPAEEKRHQDLQIIRDGARWRMCRARLACIQAHLQRKANKIIGRCRRPPSLQGRGICDTDHEIWKLTSVVVYSSTDKNEMMPPTTHTSIHQTKPKLVIDGGINNKEIPTLSLTAVQEQSSSILAVL